MRIAQCLALLTLWLPYGVFAAEGESPSHKMEAIFKKHHFAMLDKGILTADANYAAAVGSVTFLRGLCGDEVVTAAQLGELQARAEEFVNIPKAILAQEARSVTDELNDSFANAGKDVAHEICENAKAR
jgi:hypothetical protein